LTQSYLNYVGNGTYLKDDEFASKLSEINNESSDLKKIDLVNGIFNKVFLNNQKAQLFLLRGMSYSRMMY